MCQLVDLCVSVFTGGHTVTVYDVFMLVCMGMCTVWGWNCRVVAILLK